MRLEMLGTRLRIPATKYDRQLRRIRKRDAHRRLMLSIPGYQLTSLGFYGNSKKGE